MMAVIGALSSLNVVFVVILIGASIQAESHVQTGKKMRMVNIVSENNFILQLF